MLFVFWLIFVVESKVNCGYNFEASLNTKIQVLLFPRLC